MKLFKMFKKITFGKIKSRPRTFEDIKKEDIELKSAGKYTYEDYYEGVDGPVPPAIKGD